MINDFEKLVNLFSSVSKRIDPETIPEEERAALVETTKKLIEICKVTIEQLLLNLEKNIEEGKISDQETIQKIREFRDKYNAL